jgi:hypothetical protein
MRNIGLFGAAFHVLGTPLDRHHLTQGELGQVLAVLGADVARSLCKGQRDFAVDGACPIDRDAVINITKGSAIALSVAAPGAANIGREITFLSGSDFAHVVTFTGATLRDGTAGLNSTWTTTAVAGCSLTVRAVTAALWSVVSFNLGTIAP